MESSSKEKFEEKYTFPKKVGIVFLERRKRLRQGKYNQKKDRDELSLNFDQDACAYFILQMNQHQDIFEFQIIDIPIENNNESLVPKEKDKEDLLSWVDTFASRQSKWNIDYWMGITGEQVSRRPTWDFDGRKASETKSHKMLWIITSGDWDEKRAPPSLFEFLLATVFRCSLESLSREFDDIDKEDFLRHKFHKVTRGCIFDFTHRRASVSIFKLCYGCRNRLSYVEKQIRNKCKDVNLLKDVTTILSKEWMGTPEKRDSPIYNLKKIYKYDIDRNTGFNKRLREKFIDSVTDNIAQWTIGTVATGLIGIILAIILKH